MKYYHGGKTDLKPGDLLVPSPPHVHDVCPICVARSEGRTIRVGEYLQWVLATKDTSSPQARKLVEMLASAHPDEPMDPPSQMDGVYVTSDCTYARWYAARSRGDLYQVEPIGPLLRSKEDHFAPSWAVPRAKVLAVLERRVLLNRQDRRRYAKAWEKADRNRWAP